MLFVRYPSLNLPYLISAILSGWFYMHVQMHFPVIYLGAKNNANLPVSLSTPHLHVPPPLSHVCSPMFYCNLHVKNAFLSNVPCCKFVQIKLLHILPNRMCLHPQLDLETPCLGDAMAGIVPLDPPARFRRCQFCTRKIPSGKLYLHQSACHMVNTSVRNPGIVKAHVTYYILHYTVHYIMLHY